jgi:hypothetical protein
MQSSPKLFCDETRCPVLDPGRGKTKTGFLWAIARDDRPWGGTDPPAVLYSYAPGRGGVHAVKLLDGFAGVLRVDGYAGYNALADPARSGGPVTLAYCWSHLRRKFYEVYVGGHSPIATEALSRIKELYAIEDEARGLPPELRRRARQERTKPAPRRSSLVRAETGSCAQGRQNRRGAQLWPQPLGRSHALPRRRPHRDRFQHRRALDPRPGDGRVILHPFLKCLETLRADFPELPDTGDLYA